MNKKIIIGIGIVVVIALVVILAKYGFEEEPPEEESLDCNGADINQDGKVDSLDYIIIKRNLGKTCSEPDWCENSDMNKDGIVSQSEVNFINSHLGESCTID